MTRPTLATLGACEAIFDAGRRIEAMGGTAADTIQALALVLGAHIRCQEEGTRAALAREIWTMIKEAASIAPAGPESASPVSVAPSGPTNLPPNGQTRS